MKTAPIYGGGGGGSTCCVGGGAIAFPPNYTPAPACVPCLNEIVACLVGYLPIPKLGCVWYELLKKILVYFNSL